MKKISCIIGIFVVVINMVGCNTRLLPIEQSKKNFIQYQSSMKNILNSYGYQMQEIIDENITDDKDSVIRQYEVNITDSVFLFIRYENQNGREAFVIDYITNIPDRESVNKNINISLFVELVNSISGKEVTKELCDEFLNAPEEEYPSSHYNSEKTEDEIIKKIKALNFGEDWIMTYELTEDLEETFGIGGLTKQLEG